MTRERERIEWQELLFAQLIAWTVNTGMCRPKKPVEVKDFMPSRWGAASAAPAPRKNRISKQRQQEIADSFRRLMAEHGVQPTRGH